MAFFGDYHTHTNFSHGKGTIEENVLAAIKKGLKEIAITDHGFKHMIYNVRRMDWPYMEREVKRVRQLYPEINVYLGLETNFNSHRGFIDVLPSEISSLDVVICGYHKLIKSDSIKDYYKFWLPNFFMGNSKKMLVRNTDMHIKALEKYEIDFFAHPNKDIKMDVKAVAEAAKFYGTYLELNAKAIMTDLEIEVAAKTGVEFIVSSDAHSPDRVGDFDASAVAAKRVGVPFSQIANWERVPKFRSVRIREKLKRVDEYIL